MIARAHKTLRLCAAILMTAIACAMPMAGQAHASDPAGTLDLGNCGGADTAYSTFIRHTPPAGIVYVRLNNSQEPASQVSVYTQNTDSGVCQLLGSTMASYGQWAKVGTYDPGSMQGLMFVANGADLQAPPYAAVASLLITPEPLSCTPTGCAVQYQGHNGQLLPQIVSGATDEVGIYTAKPVTDIALTNVTYYADNTFIYNAKKIEPVNRNYLRGGVHMITMQVRLANQQTLLIMQQVDNGDDFTDIKYFKSLFYRADNKILFFGVIGMLLGIALCTLWLARIIYKRQKFQREHGLEDYHPDEDTDDGSNTPIVSE